MNEPSVMVPVTVLLNLARTYKELPQELCDLRIYQKVDRLEKVAYRKYLHYKKELQNGR